MTHSLPEWSRSFRQPNYQRFFVGQAISMVGTFMQTGAIPWVVWTMTRSAWWLGAATFLNQIPFLGLGLIGGAIADRCSRRPLIWVMQCCQLVQAGLLATLMFTDHLTMANLMVLIVVQGIVNAIDFPARQAFTMDLVGPEDLSNAIALNASLVHTMRVIGPVLAGIILLRFGAGVCFLVNAFSYLAILVALMCIDPRHLYPSRRTSHDILPSLREGLQIIWASVALRRPLMLVAIISLTCGYYLAFLPYYADHVFGGGPDLLGYLMGASATGAVAGAILLARAHQPRLERWVPLAGGIMATGLAFFSHLHTVTIALPVLVVVGMGLVLLISGTSTIIQQRAPADARGRVVSYITTAYFGLTPVGSLLAGMAAAQIGVPKVLAIGSGLSLLTTLWYLRTARP